MWVLSNGESALAVFVLLLLPHFVTPTIQFASFKATDM